MAFFDEIGKKVTEVGQKTVQKSLEFTEISKLNMMISDEEKNLSALYGEIGKLYLKLHKDDYEDAFAEVMKSVNTTEKKIHSYKNQIVELKGVQRCEKCGAALPQNAAFCSSGGTPASRQTQSKTSICKYCGAKLVENASFCATCGKPIKSSDDIVSAVEAALKAATKGHNADFVEEDKKTETVGSLTEETVIGAVDVDYPQYEPESIPATLICPDCGAEVPENYVFCNRCGARLK